MPPPRRSRSGKGSRKGRKNPGPTHPHQDLLEGRNPVWECLRRGHRRVHRILLDPGAQETPRIREIREAARAAGVPVEPTPRETLDRLSVSGVHNGIMAFAEPFHPPSVARLTSELLERGEDPLLVLVDEPRYEQNIGAILRSALGAGVHGVVIPTRRGRGCSAVVQRVAMGAAEEVPLIREGLSSSLALIRRQGIPVVGAHMGGRPPWEVDLTGPLALVVGGEDKGLSPTLRKRCDLLVGIPLQGGLQSLNLSVSTGILLFERIRQLAGAPPPSSR